MSKTDPEYYAQFDETFATELSHIENRWRAKEARRGVATERIVFDPERLRGIALSGGGIRSASFCMGVIQQLHQARVIDRLHYMSTVSGGGYTGSSLSWFLAQKDEDENHIFGTGGDNFPFSGGEAAGVRNARADDDSHDKSPPDGREVLDYIRQRSSYLNPGAGFTLLAAIAILLRSMLISIFGYLLLLSIVFVPFIQWELIDYPIAKLGWAPFPVKNVLNYFHWPMLIALALLLILGISIALYSLLTGLPWLADGAYALRRGYQRIAGYVLGWIVALLAIELLFHLISIIANGGVPLFNNDVLSFGVVSAGLGATGGLLARMLRVIPESLARRMLMAALPPLALLLLLIGLGVLAHAVARLVVGNWTYVVALVGFTLAYCIWTNINLTGLHRFYRDRLMESFMPDLRAIASDGQAAHSSADGCDLASVCGEDDDGPFQLINTHVILLGAGKARQRSRGGDSFVLSPLFSGSEATGFIKTEDWMPGPASLPFARRHGPLALPTAMAISGAALNPRAGGDGKGLTKGGAVSALLNLLNLRLGYWVPSPSKATGRVVGASYRAPPNFIYPGLVQGMFGFRHHEQANWLELSDGGHFENTGIYELVRRRVRTIIFADGSTDPEIALASFANALEKIYVDFSVRVTFDEGDDFTNLLKGTAEKATSILAERLSLSKAGFAVGTIHYPPSGNRGRCKGRFFYVKSTLIEKLPVALYSYRASNPLFPSESLADQFFSEQQFEAYRALGFAVTQTMMKRVDNDRTKEEEADSLADWLGLD